MTSPHMIIPIAAVVRLPVAVRLSTVGMLYNVIAAARLQSNIFRNSLKHFRKPDMAQFVSVAVDYKPARL